jgi:hypothetical protein
MAKSNRVFRLADQKNHPSDLALCLGVPAAVSVLGMRLLQSAVLVPELASLADGTPEMERVLGDVWR